MMPDLSLSSAVLPAILLGIAAIIVFGILGVFFAVQRARLPEATRLWDLQTRIASAQTDAPVPSNCVMPRRATRESIRWLIRYPPPKRYVFRRPIPAAPDAPYAQRERSQ